MTITLNHPKRWAVFTGTPWKRIAGIGAAAAAAAAVVVGGGVYKNPPPPPTGGQVTCLRSTRANWVPDDCIANATINVTNAIWTCNASVSSIATAAGGTPPVRVIQTFTQVVATGAGGMTELLQNCTGDGNTDTVDFIFKQVGLSGVTGGVGGDGDSFKLKPFASGPHDLEFTGNIDCGVGVGHSDAWQIQTAANRNVTGVNVTTGDWDAGTSTCKGAGGAVFWSGGSGINVEGGKFVTCNHGLNANNATGTNSVIGASFRSGRGESTATGGDPNCQDTAITQPCIGTGNLTTFTGVTCQAWNPNTDTWQ